MKKTVLAFALLIATASFAQNFSGGIKAGANFSNFTGGEFDAVKKKAIVKCWYLRKAPVSTVLTKAMIGK